MSELSTAEENYLKAIYKLSEQQSRSVRNSAIAQELNTSAASVTDMLLRLAGKELVHYESHKGVWLTDEGLNVARQLVRRHRLWETFLVDKLGFSWDEVHEPAEQLEHIDNKKLVDRLDEFLGRPRFDPHGDPIPDANGQYAERRQVLLAKLEAGQTGVVVGVQEHSTEFLQHLDYLGLVLGARVEVLQQFAFDHTLLVRINGEHERHLSQKISQYLLVQPAVSEGHRA